MFQQGSGPEVAFTLPDAYDAVKSMGRYYRYTKIIATVGPATESPEMLES